MMTSPQHTKEVFKFRSLEEEVVGELYLPIGDGPFPAVIAGPGFAGVKEILLPIFAIDLANNGYACLLVDFVGFGESGGKLRQDIRPFDQVQNLKDGLTALEKDARIDKSRLGVWGSSLGATHTLVNAADDPRVKAAVAIIPHISIPKSAWSNIGLLFPVVMDVIGRAAGHQPALIRVTGAAGEKAVMTTDGAQQWMSEVTKQAPNYRDEVTYASLLQMMKYNTKPYAQKIKIPLLAVCAVSDGITPASRIHDALKGVQGVELKDYPGTHFGLFGEYLDANVKNTTEWFKMKL